MLLSIEQIDVLKEIINLGVGKSAGLLNQMVNHHVTLKVPTVNVEHFVTVREKYEILKEVNLSSVRLGFHGEFSGITEIVFPSQSALNLVALLTGEKFDSPDFDSFKEGTLSEVANILLNSIMGSISNVLNTHFEFDLPYYSEEKILNLLSLDSDSNPIILFGETHFQIEDLQIEGNIFFVLELVAFEQLKNILNRILDSNG